VPYNLSEITKRANPRAKRKGFFLPDITAPAVRATDLYRNAYKPMIDVWYDALPAINGAYARSLNEIIQDDAADVNATLDEAQAQVLRLMPFLSTRVRDWAFGVGEYVTNKWRGAILSACKVDVGTLLGPEAIRAPLSTVIEWNVALIKDVSTQTQQKMANTIFSGLNQRKAARDVAKELSEISGMARDRSLRIASDQLSKAAGSVAEERQREAGIEEVEWVHSRKKFPRKEHQARNGKVYYLETKKAVDGGETVPADDWVQQKPYCGCRTRAWIDLSDD